MQLESHATPPRETPQQRYATLHRAIERGLDSDEIWKELAEVSLRLGHGDEAATCLRRIRDRELHQTLEKRLVRLGVIDDPSARPAAPAPAAPPVPRVARSRRPTGAPAASHAGARRGPTADHEEIPGLGEHVLDALQYLFHQHMPWLVMVTTLAFPVVVGLGGFLTAGGSPLVLAAIAALPGLSVLAVTGAMGRQILLASSGGSADVPNVPDLGQLVRDARTFLLDAGLVLGAFLAPPIVAMALGAPFSTTVPPLVIGAFFAPMAWGLRQIRGDFGALSPVTLLRGLSRCGLHYAGIVPVCWLLFAPAALATWAVFGRPIWVQIAAVGPLCVVPLFAVSRLIGTWLDTMRTQLGTVLVGVRKAPKAVAEAKAEPKAKAARPQRTARAAEAATTSARFPRRPEGLEHFAAPNVRPLSVRQRANGTASQQRPSSPNRPARPAPRQVAGKPPAQRSAPAASRPTGSPPRPQPKPRPKPEPRAIEGRGPQRPQVGLDDAPDLTQMPGAVVVTGSERARRGAAARPQG